MSDWTLTVDVPNTMWMSANRPLRNHAHRQMIVRNLQWLARSAYGAQAPGVLPDPCRLTWTIHYPKGVTRKADAPNSYPTCKALLDGLVNSGAITDDNNDRVVSQTWERGPNLTSTGTYRITVTGTRSDEDDT